VAPAQLPFRLVSGFLIVVDGAIGPFRDLNFALDTGSSRTVIHNGIARAAGLKGSPLEMEAFGERVASEGVLTPLTVGPIHRDEILVLTADLRAQEQRFGSRLDAIVGMDLLGDRCLTIDYVSRTLTFDCTGEWPARVSLESRARLPLVDISLDGTAYRLIVDSGSQALVVFRHALPPHAGIQPDAEISAMHVSGTIRLKRFTAGMFTIGQHSLGPSAVFILEHQRDSPGYDGVLGLRSLRAARVQLDFSRRVLSWS
jgi:hypothetical protein